MEIGQFFSKEAQKVLLLNKTASAEDIELEVLKEALWKYRVVGTIKEWNGLREEAKEHFSKEVISRLDASGFITEWMKGR